MAAARVGRAPDTELKTKVFISYSRKDMAFADRLEAALKERGFKPLIDREGIYAFEDWWKRIEVLIRQADTVVFALSPEAVKSDVALKEVAYATSLNKRFAPVVCRRVEDSAVPEPLRRLNFIFLDDAEHFEASADKLADALKTDIVWIRQHTEFGEAAKRWIEAGRAGGLLLRPPILDQAETWLTLRPAGAPPPTAETEAFLVESRNADTESKIAQARTRTRWRRAQAALYLLLTGISLGLVGWINQSTIAEQWRWWTIGRPFVAANVAPYVLKPAAEQVLKPGDPLRECVAREQDNDYCPDMVVVPAGSFMMGSPPSDGDDGNDGPQHQVTIASPFAVSKYELTFAEWDTCAAYGDCPRGVSDSGFGRGFYPVINVIWDDAQHYAAWLSKMTGKTYRLLSEAEYEYAARGGSQAAYSWGDQIKLNGVQMAKCARCGSYWPHNWGDTRTSPVGLFAANRFGLYDMAGNVWEWTEDCVHTNNGLPTYDGAPTDGSAWIKGGDCDSRAVRGGSWADLPEFLRSAYRNSYTVNTRNNNLGFRVARILLGH